jgi:DNA anti-recombination protein RmuC
LTGSVTWCAGAQEYAEYLAKLNSETEESSCVGQLEAELKQLQLEEAALVTDLAQLKAVLHDHNFC